MVIVELEPQGDASIVRRNAHLGAVAMLLHELTHVFLQSIVHFGLMLHDAVVFVQM
jgi:hypothetical protein